MRKIFLPAIATVVAISSVSAPAWAVSSTPVTIMNPADIAKAEGIQQPYQASAHCSFAGPSLTECDAAVNTPASQRLVIELVSGTCFIPLNNNIRSANIDTSVGGKAVQHWLVAQPPTTASSFAGQQVNINQPVRIYADKLTTVILTLYTWNSSKGFSCDLSLSGQAVTVP